MCRVIVNRGHNQVEANKKKHKSVHKQFNHECRHSSRLLQKKTFTRVSRHSHRGRRRKSWRFCCREPHLSDMRAGKKIVDVRMHKNKYKRVRIGDLITFYHVGRRPPGRDYSDLTCMVTNYYTDDTFELLFRKLSTKHINVSDVLPGCSDVKEGVTQILSLSEDYPDDEQEFGVIGFAVSLCYL